MKIDDKKRAEIEEAKKLEKYITTGLEPNEPSVKYVPCSDGSSDGTVCKYE